LKGKLERLIGEVVVKRGKGETNTIERQRSYGKGRGGEAYYEKSLIGGRDRRRGKTGRDEEVLSENINPLQ